MQCTTCGYENGIEARVCTLCGTRLDVQVDQPHRVPTGVGISRPLVPGTETVERSTDHGSGSFSAIESGPPTEREAPPFPRVSSGHKTPMMDVGLRQALADDDSDEPDEPLATPSRGIPSSDLSELVSSERPATPLPPTDVILGRIKLVVEQGLIIGEQYLLSEPEMLIGRADPDARSFPDIDLGGQDNDYVHRAHARLTFHDLNTRLSVEHLGGANPTLVNNQLVELGELVELHVGDRLRVGRVVMRLHSV